MHAYFVDAWYLIALADSSDSHHRQVKRLDPRLTGTPLLTHDGVLTEFLTYFAAGGRNSRSQAAALVRDIVSRSSEYQVERSSDLFFAALALYAQRPDKEYSLVDCMSMTLMRERGITHVLTNDHHFRQEGFTVVNE
ncbi:MAG TPA: PIN domain-containing protein [Thermoanaerobaculia bacterium]|jgi:predicted nucleic acid-binding protein|nr:PIN domain-containing protein [Thermoanaerobaculia bacterium]